MKGGQAELIPMKLSTEVPLIFAGQDITSGLHSSNKEQCFFGHAVSIYDKLFYREEFSSFRAYKKMVILVHTLPMKWKWKMRTKLTPMIEHEQ
jgi:hypothetical protein